MKWIKKNKFTCIAILLFVLIAVVGYKAMKVFFPDTKSAIYGDRLDNKVEVKKKVYETLKTKISELEYVKNVNIRESGRIIYITVLVNDSTSMDSAKAVATMITEPFSEIQLGYYDFQLFVKKEDSKENNFPISAYKHHNRSEFVWVKERDKTE